MIAANRVELAPKARITGTLTYALLEMSMGAEINGKLIHAEQEPKKLEYDGNKRPQAKPKLAEGNKQQPAKPAIKGNNRQPPSTPASRAGDKATPAAMESNSQSSPQSAGAETNNTQASAKPAETEKQAPKPPPATGERESQNT